MSKKKKCLQRIHPLRENCFTSDFLVVQRRIIYIYIYYKLLPGHTYNIRNNTYFDNLIL